MPAEQPLPVNTASRKDSIWRDINQSAFRKCIHDLAEKNDFPGNQKVHSHQEWKDRGIASNDKNHVLPFDVEERLANDFAFIAAAKKEVEAVSAVVLEEAADSQSLIVRLAANGTISEVVMSRLTSILATLQKCARGLSRTLCREQTFDDVIDLNRDRIHARLQSKHFQLPKGSRKSNGRPLQREPLGPKLQALARQSKSKALNQDLAALCTTYSRVDDCTRGTDEEKELLRNVVRQSHDFCTPKGRTIKQTIASYDFKGKDVLEDKHIRQVNKLGRYWGLCEDIAEASRKHGSLFQNIQLQKIPKYEPSNVPLPSKGKIPCFVHAEIQLLIYYTLHPDPNIVTPRVLGVSKSACYLCNLFILNHREFFITKTHGRLYPLWTLPDLAAYDETQRTKVRRVLAKINQEIQKALKQPYKYRAWPIESYVHLAPGFLSSPVPSDLGTVLSGANSDATVAGPSGTKTPRALSLEAIPRSARAERLEKRNLLKEVQDTRKVPGTPEEPPTSSHPEPTRVSPVTTQPHPTNSPLLAAGPSTPPPPPPPPPMTSPTPPSSPIPTPLAITRGDLPKSRARIPVHQNPGLALSTAAELPSSPSSSSIQSWEYPIERTITTTSPFRSKHDKLSLTFEIEGTGHGNVAIAHFSGSKEPATGIPINLRAMKENEILHFEREHEGDHLVLNLQHSGNQSTQIKLQWL